MSRKKVKSFAAHAKDALWRQEGLRPYFTYRDLGIKDATEGKVLAHIIRARQPCTGPLGYHSHDLDFQMVYLINGWARLYFEDIGEIRVEAGDAWYQPPGIRHEVLEYSDDWEVIEITMPAEFDTHEEQRQGFT
jgi:mannose-6-phosphate isomerase-like protein (cupin superfamily)